MNDDFFIKKLLESSDIIKKEYWIRYNDEVEYLRQKKKRDIKEHEWWKEYVQEETIHDINLAAKYRILCYCVRLLIKDFIKNKEILRSIFSSIEACLEQANEYDLGKIEILFFEGILNGILTDDRLYDSVMSILGPKSRALCDRNNEFWEKSGVTNGSIASAVRNERQKSNFGSRNHIEKAKDVIAALEKWIDQHPTASPGDRAAAENTLKNLTNSLGY